MYVIFGNFGDNTIALMQWANEQCLEQVNVVSVDTQWGSEFWKQRVELAKKLSRDYNFSWQRITADNSFSDLVLDRKSFPSTKYQWCAYFLKGMLVNSWLDKHDLDGIATIILPLINQDGKSHAYTSEYFGDRKIMTPLMEKNVEDIIRLVNLTGISAINIPSQECYPCIHATNREIANLSLKDADRVFSLEKKVNKAMFSSTDASNIYDMIESAKQKKEDNLIINKMPCVSNWACRL